MALTCLTNYVRLSRARATLAVSLRCGRSLSHEGLSAAAHGEAAGERAAAALRFATKLVRKRGWVKDEDLKELRAAGFGDGEVVEIVAAVALNTFTNYFNHVAQTEVDFPLVKAAGY